MFRLRSPSAAQIEAILRMCDERSPNSPCLSGLDIDDPPSGFVHDDYGADLGTGRDVFDTAVRALRTWSVYPPGWTQVHTAGRPIVEGLSFVSVIRHFGFYSVLPGRVRHVEETDDRFAFSFLTLEGHAEIGVEQFAVSLDSERGIVRYQVTAASRPTGIVRLGAPVARALQMRFQRDSVANMRRVARRGVREDDRPMM